MVVRSSCSCWFNFYRSFLLSTILHGVGDKRVIVPISNRRILIIKLKKKGLTFDLFVIWVTHPQNYLEIDQMQCSINKMLLTLSNWVGCADDQMSSAFKKKGFAASRRKAQHSLEEPRAQKKKSTSFYFFLK